MIRFSKHNYASRCQRSDDTRAIRANGHSQVRSTLPSPNHINSTDPINRNHINTKTTTAPFQLDSRTHIHIKNELQTNHQKKLHSIRLGKSRYTGRYQSISHHHARKHARPSLRESSEERNRIRRRSGEGKGEQERENLKRLQAVLARVVVEVDYAPC